MDMLTPKFYDFNFLIQRKLLNVLTQANELYFEDKTPRCKEQVWYVLQDRKRY